MRNSQFLSDHPISFTHEPKIVNIFLLANFWASLIWDIPYSRYYKTPLYFFLRLFGTSSIQEGLIFRYKNFGYKLELELQSI